jgi:hypothetical protein
MLDQMFETFRKTSASFLQMQQELFKQWMQQWPAVPVEVAGASTDWGQKVHKRWVEFTTESLNMHREMLDSMYKAGIQIMEQGIRLSESTNPEDYRREVVELRRKMFETLKGQSEGQLREFEKEVEKWSELFLNPSAEKVH